MIRRLLLFSWAIQIAIEIFKLNGQIVFKGAGYSKSSGMALIGERFCLSVFIIII